MERRKTPAIRVGSGWIGGDAPVSVQGMAKVPTSDVASLVRQVRRMERAGAELVRVSVLRREETGVISILKRRSCVPIVADIHYDYRLALAAMDAGADKVRINPGNMPREKLREIVRVARERGVAIRIGLNSGSLPIRGNMAAGMVKHALDMVRHFEDLDFRGIVLSLKTPSVPETIECYRGVAERCRYPLHLGITEAGRGSLAEAKSVLGIGALLLEGIGDTIRVSLTDKPETEIRVARAILQAAGARRFEPEIISCPTCGRTRVDLKGVLSDVEKGVRLLASGHPSVAGITVAVMGCSVNGPGEARRADVGIAGGIGRWALFRKGKVVASYPERLIVGKLLEEIRKWRDGRN